MEDIFCLIHCIQPAENTLPIIISLCHRCLLILNCFHFVTPFIVCTFTENWLVHAGITMYCHLSDIIGLSITCTLPIYSYNSVWLEHLRYPKLRVPYILRPPDGNQLLHNIRGSLTFHKYFSLHEYRLYCSYHIL